MSSSKSQGKLESSLDVSVGLAKNRANISGQHIPGLYTCGNTQTTMVSKC